MAASDNKAMLEAAQQMWETLDQMASSDPEGYKKFIKQQLDEGKDVLAAPEPVFCLQCNLKGDKMRYLYINVCKWTKVPRPKTDDDPIPVKGGVLRHLLYKDSKRKTRDVLYDVAFHPCVLEECMKQKELENMLISLCLDYVENEAKVNLASRESSKKIKETHKGALNDIRSSIDEQWRDCLDPDTRLDIGETLLQQIREMKTTADKEERLPELKLAPDENHGVGVASSTRPHPQGSGTTGTKLIQEMPLLSDSTILVSRGVSPKGGVSERGTCVPEHRVCVVEGEGQEEGQVERAVKMRVTLPGVQGVRDVELEVSEDDLVLTVGNRYRLSTKLPELVDDEQTKAIFNTAQSLLIITMPCLNQ